MLPNPPIPQPIPHPLLIIVVLLQKKTQNIYGDHCYNQRTFVKNGDRDRTNVSAWRLCFARPTWYYSRVIAIQRN